MDQYAPHSGRLYIKIEYRIPIYETLALVCFFYFFVPQRAAELVHPAPISAHFTERRESVAMGILNPAPGASPVGAATAPLQICALP